MSWTTRYRIIPKTEPWRNKNNWQESTKWKMLCVRLSRKRITNNNVYERGSEFSSYEIELRNWVMQNDVTLRVTNSKSKNKKFHFTLLTRSWKIKSYTSNFELLSRRFNFHFSTLELLTRSWKIKNHASSY